MVSKVLPSARSVLCAVGLSMLFGASAFGQAAGVIRGRVTDAAARPIPEVAIGISGTTLGALTNSSGDYVLSNVPAGRRVVTTRRIGYTRATQAVEVPASGDVRADFQLVQAAAKLEEVVVTGTAGSAERRTIGNSVTTVDVAELTSKTSLMSVTEIFQGKTPGLMVLPGSGVPGTGGEIRIRGASSTIGYKPVVFIDGVRFNIDDVGSFAATGGGTLGLAQSTQVTTALNNLNPNDIESIEIIKGPAAATLYGAEAANGVIQIITKKGNRGQAMRWGIRGEVAQNQWHLLPEDNYTTCDAAKRALTVSATDLRPLWPGCQDAAGVSLNQIIRDNPLARDPRALRDGNVIRHSLNVSGGSDRYSYYLAGDRDVEQGPFFNSDQNRTSVRTNLAFSPNDRTDFSVSVNYSDGQLRLPIQDESANGLLLAARRGTPGRITRFSAPTAADSLMDAGWASISPRNANRYKNFTATERLTLSGRVGFTPVPWFQNRFTMGFDNLDTQAQLLFLPGDIESAQDADAASGANLRKTPLARILTIDYNGSLLYNLREALTTTTSFGAQVVADKRETLFATGIGMGAEDVTLVGLLTRTTGSESYSENNSVGYYVQEQVGWKDRLFVTGAVRADDHSSFGTNFDLIVYPKFSVSYVASDEPALQRFLDPAKINTLQLRAAWGQAGRAPNAYSASQTFTTFRVTQGTTTGLGLIPSAYGNPGLKAERGEEIELGFEAGMLSNRLGLDFTFYDKKTSDMLQSVAVPASSGFVGTYLSNLGTVKNSGIEVAVWGTAVNTERVTWEPRLTFATNKNKLLTFGVPLKEFESPTGQPYGVVQQHRVGYPLGGFWVTPPLRCGIDNPPPAPATTRPCSVNGEPILTAAGAAIFNPGDTARRYFGSSIPTRDVGFANTVTLFKYLRLYALLDHKGGHKVFNLQERNRCQAANDNCARVNNPAARFPGTTAQDSVLFKELAVYRGTGITPEFIQKGDFIKLREVSATFDVPTRYAQKARASAAFISLSARNLAVWSDYEGVDPEVNTYGGRNFVRVDAYAAPMLRRLSATINLTY
jgi:TonB-linked SusC/RagA family outer membrane protein